jgi:hypothetical protein
MRLRERLRAGLRMMSDGWARDLCVLYGVMPGEELRLSVRRPDGHDDALEVRVEPPDGHRRAATRPEPGGAGP